LGAGLDGFTNLPPAAIWANLIFSILCSVAILKYHLLDIRLVVRKSLVYLLVSVTVAVPYVSILLLLNQILKATIEPWWVHAIIILLLAIVLRPLYSWAQHLVDRLFYRDRYDHLRALQRFGHEAQSVVNLEELGANMVQLVSSALRTSSAYLLLPSESKQGLVVVSSTGLDSPPSGVILMGSSPLVKWLELHGDILSTEQLDIAPQLQSFSLKEKSNLERMGAKLYVPIKTRQSQLSGILVLGQKLSQQSYSDEDKQLLTALSSQMAMALENARLYSDALRARENLETWLNSMTDCVMIINTDYAIQFMNKAAIEKFSTRVGEKCWTALRRDVQCSNCPVERAPYSDNNREGFNFIKTVGDSHYDVAGALLLNPDGSLSIIEVLRDITERKRGEAEKRELEQKAQLASRLASVGEMASGIAHEINNPLTGVIGFAQLLMQKDIPEDIRDDVKIINDGTQRVASIVKRLLAFARQHKPERTYVNINQIIETTLALRAYETETSSIKVTTQLDPVLPRTMADGGQLQQVFLNITINAETEMKLAHGRGNLLIKTETIDNTIRISFEDDGPGIAKENLDKIFEPFFTTKGVAGGTGLGLSLSYGIVKEHNGGIYARSELGKGATFIVELPIVTEAKQLESAEQPIEESKRVAGAKVLVVDDEQAILQLLSRTLTDEGHEVETVDNAADALERIKSKRYNLILLDIKLPGMSGFELYKHLQEVAASLARRAVFITGDVMEADTKDFLSKTKSRYITKPFDLEQLKNDINRILTQDA